MLKVYKSGPHGIRTPLSYPALWPLFQDRITLVDRPSRADLCVFAHVLDIQDAPYEVIADWRARQPPVVLLSEEPFWDTIWGGRPLDPVIYVETAWGALPVRQLNHCTSAIYRFRRIPYYLLTNHRFANAYRYRFARNAARPAADWQQDFARRPVDLTFMFERRAARHHWVEWPGADLTGLCSRRTDLAEACTTGVVERLGQSWQGGQSRFALSTDWHMDKLTRLDGRARLMGALENTHHPDYITEKVFDAFACGSLPVYWASPGHRIHELGLPEGSRVNLWGMTPEDGAAHLQDRARHQDAKAVREANVRLQALFSEPQHWLAERRRVQSALVAELEQACARPA
ncbi:glycosyltransferase family 10 domain-containing protein [Ponticoccus litoralis]|uniref:Glycosyltransferase family 10 n=1 Tax=Ponticoccus litoralis TaxID=422297 RepID=A0AAW9SQU5_9RHOB